MRRDIELTELLLVLLVLYFDWNGLLVYRNQEIIQCVPYSCGPILDKVSGNCVFVHFLMVLLVIFVVSYANFQRSKVKSKQTQENFLEMDSGDEILGKYQKQMEFSRREIWLKAVNGYRNMADSNVIYRIAMVNIFVYLQ